MSEENAKQEASSSQSGDTDKLADLLDSALDGFAKPSTRATDDELDELMQVADAKAAQNAARDFQGMLQQMIAVQEEMVKKAETETPVEGAEPGPNPEEAKAMMEAMRELMACSGAVANAQSPEDIFASLEQLGGTEMEPIMHMMMQAFMSKDVLYPPLKEMHLAYPDYLEKHRAQLDADTLSRYEKQFELIGRICGEFEQLEEENKGEAASGEGAAPTGAEVPSALAGPPAGFERIGHLLVELQTNGYPPAELTGSLPAGFAIDEAGVPRVDDPAKAAEACSIM